MTHTFSRVCQCCGTAFISVSPIAKWCSGKCRVKACYYRRDGRQIPEHCRTGNSSFAIDQALPVQWQEQSTPGHEARVWAGTAIARRLNDGYINATAMCQANGKRWFDYERLDSTQDYIKALREHLNWTPENPSAHVSPCIDAPGLVISTKGGPPRLQGTWIHPRLAVDLARWISPAFAVWMDGWFLESMQRPAQPLALAPTLAEGVHVVASDPRHADWLWLQAVEKQVSAALMAQYGPTKGGCWTGPVQQQQRFQLHLIAA